MVPTRLPPNPFLIQFQGSAGASPSHFRNTVPNGEGGVRDTRGRVCSPIHLKVNALLLDFAVK